MDQPPSDASFLQRVATSATGRIGQATYQSLQPEDRLRSAVADSISDIAVGSELAREVAPSLPYWGKPLGGHDLKADIAAEHPLRLLCEFKWCKKPGKDAFDELPWDLFKLAHASKANPEAACILVYAAPTTAFENGRFASILRGTTRAPSRQANEEIIKTVRSRLRRTSVLLIALGLA